MKKGTFVKVRKLSACPNPSVSTPRMEDYFPGQDNGNVSVPVEYTVKGTLLEDTCVRSDTNGWGRGRILIARTERNGVPVAGHFGSSWIEDIKTPSEGKEVVTTENSIYLIEALSADSQ